MRRANQETAREMMRTAIEGSVNIGDARVRIRSRIARQKAKDEGREDDSPPGYRPPLPRRRKSAAVVITSDEDDGNCGKDDI